MENHTYLITLIRQTWFRNRYLSFIVETTTPISNARHLAKVQVIGLESFDPKRINDYMVFSISKIQQGTLKEADIEFRIMGVGCLHPRRLKTIRWK